MSDSSLCKWRHFEAEIILCAVQWYLRYALSYHDVEELMQEGPKPTIMSLAAK
jgi:IS6 family transposase